MTKRLLALALSTAALYATATLAQLWDSLRTGAYDFICETVEGVHVSGHTRQDKALAACSNAEIAAVLVGDDTQYRVRPGATYDIIVFPEALAQMLAARVVSPPAWESEFPLTYGDHNADTLFTLDLSNACFDPLIDHVIPEYELVSGPGDSTISNANPPTLSYTPTTGGEKLFTILCKGIAIRGSASAQTIRLTVLDPEDVTGPDVPAITLADACASNGHQCVRYEWSDESASGATSYELKSTSLSEAACELTESFVNLGNVLFKESSFKLPETGYWAAVRSVDEAVNKSAWSACSEAVTDTDPGGGGPMGLPDPDSIWYAQDFEGLAVQEYESSFGAFNVVGDQSQDCSTTEVVDGTGPLGAPGGHAFRAYLQDAGTCGRAEFRLSTDVQGIGPPTYIGSLPVPSYADVEWTDHFIYTSNQATNCTISCEPDTLGYAFKFEIVETADAGLHETVEERITYNWQNIRPTPGHSPNPPYHNGNNPHFALGIHEGRIETQVKRKPDLGWSETGDDADGTWQTWTVLTAGDIGETELNGEIFEVYWIFRPDSRTDAQGGDGYMGLYIEQGGNCPTTPVLEWNGSILYPGKYNYRSGDGSGPVMGNESFGLYADPWKNNLTTSNDEAESKIDNIIIVDSPVLAELCAALALDNFSSLGW